MREATTGLGLAEKLAVSPTDKMQRICAMGVLRDERAAPMDTELLGFEIPGVVARWRQEAITARAVRTSQGSAGVIKSLAAVRRRYDELMTRANASTLHAAAPTSPRPKPPPGDTRSRIEELIAELDAG
jgi:hypothetical protein